MEVDRKYLLILPRSMQALPSHHQVSISDHPRWIRIATSIALVLASGCSAGSGPTRLVAPTPSISLLTPDLAAAIAFRVDFGLQSDEAWVIAVSQDHDATPGISAYGVPLMPEELAALNRRDVNAQTIGPAIEAYGLLHPEDWSGAYVDIDPNVGVVAVFTKHLEQHRTDIKRLLNPKATFDVRQAEWTLTRLTELSDRVLADPSWFESVGADLKRCRDIDPLQRRPH